MKLTVTFRGVKNKRDINVVRGTVHWDGETMTVSTPRLNWVLREPIILPEGGRLLYWQENPELFIRMLGKHYKSPYFYASHATGSSVAK